MASYRVVLGRRDNAAKGRLGANRAAGIRQTRLWVWGQVEAAPTPSGAYLRRAAQGLRATPPSATASAADRTAVIGPSGHQSLS